jgi:hypothetical protein
MEYECKKCEASFTKVWGPAKCPKCGSKELWVTGGAAKSLLLTVTVAVAFLGILYLVSYVAFFGGIIGVLVAFPFVVWSVLKRRKKDS